MTDFTLHFPSIKYSFPMCFVQGKGDSTCQFGDKLNLNISIRNFFISQWLVTQRLWQYVMGNNQSMYKGDNRPVETVSYNDITSGNGFLNKLNQMDEIKKQLPHGISFRLPSETEWEYAARGGIHWNDGFHFSGSNNN